jgi:GGDEF domain-containing protein
MKALDDVLTNEMVMEASLETLTTTFREVDYIGRIGKNKIMVLLPTIDLNDAKKALGRVLGILNAKPLNVNGVPVQLRVAGVAAAFDEDQTPDAQRFAKHIARQLADMVARLKNIQVLF